MDEVSARICQQSSVGSDSNYEEPTARLQPALPQDKRICLVGEVVVSDVAVTTAAQAFGVPVVTSETGQEYARDESCSTVFVLESFEGDVYDALYKSRHPVLGPPALQQLAKRTESLPSNTRPLYNTAMSGVVVCVTGFRNKDDLTKLVPLVHHMGGSIRKEMSAKVTHLIANVSGGDKYQYAVTFRVPIMHSQWVYSSWDRRNDLAFGAASDAFVAEHKLKPFYGAKVCFVGFPEEEERHMIEVLESNGGNLTNLEDAACTHVVVDRAETYSLEANRPSPLPSPKPLTPSPSITVRSPPPKEGSGDPPPPPRNFKRATQLLETVHEKSSRKRKLLSPDATTSKRKRDVSYSENTKTAKISQFFRTPLVYLAAAHRRRTIGGAANESVASSSGAFDVQRRSPGGKIRKNLFLRTFSSSKFKQQSNDDDEGGEKLNATCFPDFSLLNPVPPEYENQLCRRNRTGPRRRAPSHTAVVDESTIAEKVEGPARAHVVKAEWFWTSVQKGVSLDEKEYLFGDYIDQVLSPGSRRNSHQVTPGSAGRRKRKRLHETLSSLAHQQSPGLHTKRRSSLVSDAGLLSVSGSFLDCTASPDKALLDGGEPVVDTPRKGLTPRQQVFLELVQTESNYVNILHIIMNMFKKQLETISVEDEPLLNNTELKIIFGNLPPIYDTHLKMLEELRWMSAHWSEDKSIGSVILKYSTDLLKSYPPFVNFFEEMKSMLTQCDAQKPRFHAFLKACQTKPECGRQGLQDLMIRPVQRLPSISLLLNDILKNTPKSNADHTALEQALASIREVMLQINENKRKTEGQRALFDIFNEIDNCPPDLVSSHRNFVAKSEVVQLSSSEGLSSKGNPLVLFLFSDQLEVCKKRSKAFNTLKSPNTANGLHKNPSAKPYKHVRLMPLSAIKRVIDIKETEECQRVFSLVFKNNDENKDRLCSFAMTDEEADKIAFLKTLCKQMATNTCTADADKFMAYLEPHQLDIDTSDVNNGTLSKAFKFATKTRLRVGRAFSFNKTPSKLKRAVSTMMSPFGSSTNLTPASQLAQMRLASYSNINNLVSNENNSTLMEKEKERSASR